MFDGGFTGDWNPEIFDPTDSDPAAIISAGAPVPITGCPTGAGLAILLAGFDDTQVPDTGVLDRIVGFERLAAWAAAGQARALAELTTRRTATDLNELPYAVEEARVLSEATTRLSAEDAAFVEAQLLTQAETLSPARLKVKATALADSLDPREIEDRHTDAADGRRVIRPLPTRHPLPPKQPRNTSNKDDPPPY